MKSIGELKESGLERCEYTDIFMDDYEDIFPELRAELNKYLSDFVVPQDECIRCGNELNGLTADVSREGKCMNCGYPGRKMHVVTFDSEEYHFRTRVLQYHPSELRG